jgi:hypothetical protein
MRRNRFLSSIGVIVAVLLLGSTAISHADIIGFSFLDDQGEFAQWLTFFLDTSVQDTNPDPHYGYYANAISAFNYRGLTVDPSLTIWADTIGETAISLWLISFSDTSVGDLNLRFLGTDMVNDLLDSPNAYMFLSGDITVGESVYAFAVPEPSTLALFCFGAVGLWGTGRRIRKNKRTQHSG